MPTVLFLPGLDGEVFSMAKIAEHTPGVRLEHFAYPVGSRPDWELLTRQVAARMQRLGTRLLAGESFGGALAQKTALLHRDTVGSLFLLSTFTREPEAFAAALGRAAARHLPGFLMRPVARLLAGWKLAGTLQGDDRRKFLDRFARLDFADLAARLELLRGFDTRGALAGLNLPLAVLCGARDPISANEAQLQAWRALPDCRLHVLPGLGHLAAAEAPAQTGALLADWARQHGA
ncbi:MAG: alpha/beta hydrolase [Planctomycetes bacterium]|nr:alpha/beta hydrolase [Planctomycetota bacterium]